MILALQPIELIGSYTKADFRRGSRDQWIQAILLVKSFKLVLRPLDKEKWQIEAKPTWHLFWRENQLVWTKKQC
jgi:hypothetical protein